MVQFQHGPPNKLSSIKIEDTVKIPFVGSMWHVYDHIEHEHKIGVVISIEHSAAYTWYTLLMSDGTIQASNSVSFTSFYPI